MTLLPPPPPIAFSIPFTIEREAFQRALSASLDRTYLPLVCVSGVAVVSGRSRAMVATTTAATTTAAGMGGRVIAAQCDARTNKTKGKRRSGGGGGAVGLGHSTLQFELPDSSANLLFRKKEREREKKRPSG